MRELLLDCWDDVKLNDVLGEGQHSPDSNYIVESVSKEEIKVRRLVSGDTTMYTYYRMGQKYAVEHYRFGGKERQNIIDRYLFGLTK